MGKKIFALAMMISVLGVFLGGCGSSDSAAPAEGAKPAEGAAAPAAPAAPAEEKK